jgi:5-methylcytosine-specific restriction endonuclease McrA
MTDYQDYIKTFEWKYKSLSQKVKVGMRCQLCNKEGTDSTLHTHHRTYDNLGNEREYDLFVLCSDCHAKFHDKLLDPPKERKRNGTISY